MSATTIQQMADRVAQLMEQRLRLRGRGLSGKLRRGGRMVPKRLRTPAELLAKAAEVAQNPKLSLQIDHARVAEAYDQCLTQLQGVNAADRRMTTVINRVASLVVSLLVLAVLILIVLRWRHLI